jgi:16S rRNA (uracil1498-N3)-methyltransferase
MMSALKQSGGGWLPELHPEASLAHALAAAPESGRLALDATGPAMTRHDLAAPLTLALGPEGGIQPDELQQLAAAGFSVASLGPTTLRFETAGVVALGIARAAIGNAATASSGLGAPAAAPHPIPELEPDA